MEKYWELGDSTVRFPLKNIWKKTHCKELFEIFLNRCKRRRFTCTLMEMLPGLLMECSLKVFLLILKPVCSCMCACVHLLIGVFRSLFMVPTEQLHNSCHNGVIRQSHLFAHLPSDLFVFITVRHVGAKLAWSHAMLWDHTGWCTV